MKLPRWSLKILFLATLMLAIVLATIQWQRTKVSKRSRALQFIESIHGIYDVEHYTHTETYRTILTYTGVDPHGFYDPKCVSFNRTIHPNEERPPITNDGIRSLSPYITRFERLELLDFEFCEMLTDELVDALPDLPNLKQVNVVDTGLTQQGVSLLREKYPNAKVFY